jgi:hypothetical protein
MIGDPARLRRSRRSSLPPAGFSPTPETLPYHRPVTDSEDRDQVPELLLGQALPRDFPNYRDYRLSANRTFNVGQVPCKTRERSRTKPGRILRRDPTVRCNMIIRLGGVEPVDRRNDAAFVPLEIFI